MVKKVFVVGASRTGTTLVSRIFKNSGVVSILNENHFFQKFFVKKNSTLRIEKAQKIFDYLLTVSKKDFFYKESLKHDLTKKIINKPTKIVEIFNLFTELEAKKNNNSIILDHSPSNIHFLSEITNFVPNSRFIIMIRHPKNVLLSKKNMWKRRYLSKKKKIPLMESIRQFISYNPFIIAFLYNSSYKKALLYQNKDKSILIKFEDLILRNERIVKQLCSFLKINFNEDMLNIKKIGSSNSPDSLETGFDKKVLDIDDKNELNNTEIKIIEYINSSIMNNSGYRKSKVKANYFLIFYYMIMLLFQLPIILILNLKLHQNIFYGFYRRFIKT